MPARPQPTQIERDKLTIDPDFDFRDIAQRPFHDITTNEVGMFKWSGVYHQIQPGFFMLRLRVPGGLLNAEQLQRAGQLAARYGQGRLCITTRQCLQFHWLRKEDIYKVIEGLEDVGVLTKNACGDVTRNVVTCPLAGVCPHELTDTRSMLLRIANDPEILDQQRNLPRKHKISVAGCHRACGQTVMNCQGWHPVRRGGADDSVVGWKFHAGGGLGAQPRMADVIFEWVPADLVVEVARATTEAYRRLGNRRNRFQARLKLVVEALGSRGFAEYVLDILRERNIEGLERIELADSPHADIGDDYLEGKSIIEQKNGRYAVRVRIPRGELHHDDPSHFAHWAQRYGDGLIMFTNRQNLILRNVRDKDKEPLIAELRTAGFELNGFEHLPDAVACVGTSACPLAVSETPNIYRRILSELTCDPAWWQEIGPLKLNMNGCPNSCAQHACVDIGLRGTRQRQASGSHEAYSIYVGGSLSGSGHVAQYLCDVADTEVLPTLRKLLEFYLGARDHRNERFGAFARRVGPAVLRQALGRRQQPSEAPILRSFSLYPFYDEVLQAVLRDSQASSSGAAPYAIQRFGT